MSNNGAKEERRGKLVCKMTIEMDGYIGMYIHGKHQNKINVNAIVFLSVIGPKSTIGIYDNFSPLLTPHSNCPQQIQDLKIFRRM